MMGKNHLSKKVAVSTLAASMVLGSVAGLSLSEKGLLSAINGTAYAYNTPGLPNQVILDVIAKVHANLHPDDIQFVRDARDVLSSMDTNSNYDLIENVWGKVSAAKSGKTGFEEVTEANVLKLLTDLSIYYYEDGRGFTNALASNSKLLDQMAKLGGLSNGLGDTVIADAQAFGEALEKALLAEMNISNAISIIAEIDGSASPEEKSALYDILSNSLTTALAQKDLKVSQVFNALKINASDLAIDLNNISKKADPNRNAMKAFAFALMKSDSAMEQVGSDSNNGLTKVFTLNIFDTSVPVSLLHVTSSNAKVSVTKNISTNTIQLNLSNTSSDTTEVLAAINLPGTRWHDRALLVKEISFTYVAPEETPAPPPGPGGGGGGPGPLTPVIPQEDPAVIVKDLETAISNPSNQQEVNKALDKAIERAGTLDTSKSVKIEGDLATAALDTKALADSFKSIQQAAQAISDKARELGANAQPAKTVATLDLGKVDAKNVEVPLSNEIIKAAINNKIDVIAVKVNGVTLAIPVKELNGDTKVSIKQQDAPKTNTNSNQRFASVTFNVEVDGANEFGEKVALRIPVSVNNVDEELLAMVKILDDGSLQIVGGTFDKDGGFVEALRDSLSSYGVIENKVVFKDTASVQDWASRQIQVAAAKGLVEGRAEGEFVPDGKVTRAEFAKMVVKAFSLENAKAVEAFDDVSDNDWFKSYVAAAVQAGLINGRSASQFDPNANITRAEMATIVSRALVKVKNYKEISDVNASLKSFADAANISDSLKAGAALAVKEGIIIGEENHQFNPNNDATRAQAAVILYRLLNK
jgi:hypothetical protein